MSAGLETRPNARTFDLEELAGLAWAGHIRIPHFQRSLRWQRRDVMRLFDSIVRGYPIGSLLLWRRPAPKEDLVLGALKIRGPKLENSLYVVDGQQRIISLANVLHPDGLDDARFALAYDLRNGKLVAPPPVEEPTTVPLPVIFDLTRVLRWFTEHPEAADYVEQANKITRTLRQFEIPAYEVTQEDPGVLREIFDRMNSHGKRLSRAEVFSGLFPHKDTAEDTASILDRIAQNLDDTLGFGLIDDDTVLLCVLARRGPDVKREIRNEFDKGERILLSDRGRPTGGKIEFPDEDRETAFDLGEEAIRRAVRFLQNDADVPHISMLPYRYLLVVLTRVFAHHPTPDPRSRLLLRRWYWRAAVAGPEVLRSTATALRSLNFAVKPDDLQGTVIELLAQVNRQTEIQTPDLRRFKTNEAATKMVLCSWWHSGPRSLTTGIPFEQDDLSQALQDRQTALDAVRYIVPRSAVPTEFRLWAADRVLLPNSEDDLGPVDSLVVDNVKDLPEEVWNEVLASHCLDAKTVELLAQGELTAFLTRRQETLYRQLTAFLRQRCEWEFEDTPPLASLIFEDEEDTEGGPN